MQIISLLFLFQDIVCICPSSKGLESLRHATAWVTQLLRATDDDDAARYLGDVDLQ